MRKKNILVFVLLSILIISSAGCQSGKNTSQPASQNNTEIDLSTIQGKNELTSTEAAALAYQEAKKWHSDASLYYMMPMDGTLSPQWRENDSAGNWELMFANQTDTSTFNVSIALGKITRAAASNSEKEKRVIAGLPVDRPVISMKQASEIVYANKTPVGIEPKIIYDIEASNYQFPGKAIWTFVFMISNTEAYAFIVDGQAGKLLGIFDTKGNPATIPEKYSTLPQNSGKEQAQNFFDSLGSGNIDEAMSLMDANMLQSASMWKENFNTIAGMKVTKIEEIYKEEWTDSLQKYKVQLSVNLKPGSQPMGWEEGNNTRWVSLVMEGGQWKIHEIANNP